VQCCSSVTTPDGRLYEIVDDDGNVVSTVTIDSLIDVENGL
jgi:hypothetical protein